MEYQEIELKGKFFVEVLASLPAFVAADEGRLIYQSALQRLYIGRASGFEEATFGYAGHFLLNNTNQSIDGNFLPGTDGTHSLGSGSYKWLEITGTTFTGTVTTATYADLAEKYTTGGFDDEYPIGTLLEVAYEEEFDLTATSGLSDCFVGVVSENPGFVMNQDSKGQLVGIVGRVPLKIIGPVNKRDIIVATINGCGKADNHEELIYKVAVALETNHSPYEKLVECIIK